MSPPDVAAALSRFREPHRRPQTLRRPRVEDVISEAVSTNPIVALVAPAGFGKTVAVSDWSMLRRRRIAWLSMSSLDTDENRLRARVAEALRVLIERALLAGIDQAAVSPQRRTSPVAIDPHDLAGSIWRAYEPEGAKLTLVIDKSDAAPDALDAILEPIIDDLPPSMRIILLSRTRASRMISALATTSPAAVIDARHLAFSRSEIVDLLQLRSEGGDADGIMADTAGWPVAVSTCIESGRSSDALVDYVESHVLPALPPPLANALIHTAYAELVTPAVVCAVTGDDACGAAFVSAARDGVFVERVEDTGRYRWNPALSIASRALLDAQPQRRRDILLRLADLLRDSDPIEAARFAIDTGARATARDILVDRWTTLVISDNAYVVSRMCATLEAATDGGDRLLALIRACALEAIGDHTAARALFEAAKANILDVDRGHEIFVLASLILEDDRAALRSVALEAVQVLGLLERPDPARLVAISLLIGWAELRCENDPARAYEHLAFAAREAEASGFGDLADQAHATLGFAYAWGGHPMEARSELAQMRVSTADAPTRWRPFSIGADSVARGWLAYWAADLAEAARQFSAAASAASAQSTFGGLARYFGCVTAARRGDQRMIDETASILASLPRGHSKGLDFGNLRTLAFAVRDEASEQSARATAVATRFSHQVTGSYVAVEYASILRRAGDPERSLRLLRARQEHPTLTFIRVETWLTRALVRRQRGERNRAHELVELAVTAGAIGDVRLPFCDSDPSVARLLVEHLEFGTAHPEFLRDCLALDHSDSPLALLSQRELDVYRQLRTDLTLSEIAERLGLSENTVRTHRRAVYRKLAVSNRRDIQRRSA